MGADRRVLVTRRPDHVHQGGLWEFPGGKLEPPETLIEGLRRELVEELGIEVVAARPLIRVHHDYGDRHVLLDVYLVTAFNGVPHGREGQPLAWWHPWEMDPAAFPAADRPIISALRLPETCLVTGADPLLPEMFLERISLALDAGVRLVQLRAHELDERAYSSLARSAYDLCARRGARLVLNADLAVAAGLPCHGVHLTATRLWGAAERPMGPGQLVGASCHDARDLARAGALGLDYALLSPVKPTPSHPGAPTLGWERFAALVDRATLPVYALGGLTLADLPDAFRHGAQGIAAIRGLWPGA